MPCLAVAVRPIDLAIFASLGLLWILGAAFIVALYRWIARFEREQTPGGPDVVTQRAEARPPQRPAPLVPAHAVARERPSASSALPSPAR